MRGRRSIATLKSGKVTRKEPPIQTTWSPLFSLCLMPRSLDQVHQSLQCLKEHLHTIMSTSHYVDESNYNVRKCHVTIDYGFHAHVLEHHKDIINQSLALSKVMLGRGCDNSFCLISQNQKFSPLLLIRKDARRCWHRDWLTKLRLRRRLQKGGNKGG